MVGILDELYPARLREIHQAPPYLFAAGTLPAEDPAIAIVGSRKASPRSLDIAGSIATALAKGGVTVLSGLAAGIDAAAQTAALAAGGRTVAIIGHWDRRAIPSRQSLPPAKARATRSGSFAVLAGGTAAEAQFPHVQRRQVRAWPRHCHCRGWRAEQSGARAQARMAAEHSRPVVLTDQVVAANEWAKRPRRPPRCVGRGPHG